ncbi:class II fructose-bisphosphate aldolase [Arachnia propionica]|uniref:Class II fructose-bisphosphate aldolase n=1 Tax=Arachnia propionica TaxID=1750 RepID=A0A3P1WWZ6_9ACTN|nr:class II fructose-bisphosphate aldolase [Arachnia propionica]RRD51089.1 class II fructose-bisphosphate aldolase [Arachnia propionica]
MTVADLRELAAAAAAEGGGLGAFNVIQLEHAEAFTEAAVEVGRPVVLQISENAVAYHGSLEPIAVATLAVARNAPVPVVVHLDHAESFPLIQEAVGLGINSVMFDASRLDHATNTERTRQVVLWCHERGVSVEAELGEVGGKNGVHDPTARTDPDEAARFVADTGVDLLAVAVGSSHAMVDRDAVLDLDLITRIRDAVPVPLVLHGSSGVSDEGMRAAIRHGMTKINVSTHFNKVFTETVRHQLVEHPELVDPRKYVGPGRKAITREAARLLAWYAGG